MYGLQHTFATKYDLFLFKMHTKVLKQQKSEYVVCLKYITFY